MIDEVVPAALAGERIDRVVALLVGCSRSAASHLVEVGAVSVDGATATSGKVRLADGQAIVIDPGRLPLDEVPVGDPSIPLTVVHEDDDLIVVDKQPGIVVHPGAGIVGGTLVNGLLGRYPELADVGERHRPGIVHRLDAGTSGLLVVARTTVAYERLVAALAAREVTREYRVLVWGHLASAHGVVDAPIGRDHRDPTRMAVVVGGRPSRTHYQVLQTFSLPAAAAELWCRLETGRTHQIRVHLSAIGHPVVGDPVYGGVREVVSVSRPSLHAAVLEFRHPVSGEVLRFESPMPADLEAVRRQFSV